VFESSSTLFFSSLTCSTFSSIVGHASPSDGGPYRELQKRVLRDGTLWSSVPMRLKERFISTGKFFALMQNSCDRRSLRQKIPTQSARKEQSAIVLHIA
jgi:hypothetical protein